MRPKYFYIILVLTGLLMGIGLGYIFFYNSASHKEQKIFIERIQKEIIKDTIKVNHIIKVPIVDTSSTKHNDSILTKIENNPKDSLEEVIIREEMVAKRNIHLKKLESDSSDVVEILNVKSKSFSNEITIEFWESPLNLTGYILSRNKLKLFGFNPNEHISLQESKDEDQLFFNSESMSLTLHKSDRFQALKLR